MTHKNAYKYSVHFSITIFGPEQPLISNDVLEPIRLLLQYHLNEHQVRNTIGVRLRGVSSLATGADTNEEPAVIVGELMVVKSGQAA